MKRNKIELEVLSLTYCQEEAGAYALLLGEVNGGRKLPIIIGIIEAQAILMHMKGAVAPRPLTHQLFVSVLDALDTNLLYVLIHKVESGVFYSYLILQSGNNIIRVDARTSDAVVLALRMHSPILIYEDVLEAERMKLEEIANTPMEEFEDKENKEKIVKMEEPTQSMSIMKEALKSAIEQEDYEKAAILRDMINNFTSLKDMD